MISSVRRWINLFLWKIPAVFALILGVLIACYSVSLPNVYQSYATILPPTGSKGFGGGAIGATVAALGVSLPTGNDYDVYYVDILESRSLRSSLCSKKYSFSHKSWFGGESKNHDGVLSDYLADGDLDLAVKKLGTMMTAVRDPKTRIVTLRATSASPELSMMLVRDSLEFLNGFIIKSSQEKGREKVRYAEGRIAEIREDLRKAEEKLSAFASRNRDFLYSKDPEIRLEGMRLEGEYRLKQQLLTTLMVSRDQAVLDERNDLPLINKLDDPVVPVKKIGPTRLIYVLSALILGYFVAWFALNGSKVSSIFENPKDRAEA